jgi:hypothetical protein
VVEDDTWEGVLQLEKDRHTVNVQQDMERDFQRRLEVELARSVQDQTVRLHRNHILDKLLSLSCPRCERVFDDFEGCFALKCSGKGGCGCGFCGWCLEDCGADSHAHVAVCPSRVARPATANGVADAYFAPMRDFHTAMAALRTKCVRGYWSSEVAKLAGPLRVQIRDLIASSLEGMTDAALINDLI